MPDPVPLISSKSYLSLVTETTWGTLPGTPTYIHLPVESYGVRFQAVNRQTSPFTGLLQGKSNRNIKGAPKGPLVSRLYGWRPTGSVSLAQFLLAWAFGNQETAELPSKSAEWAVGPNAANQRDLGLRVNQATLTLSEDNGILLNLDLMGRTEVGDDVVTTAQTLPTDRKRLVEYLFEHTTLTLNAVEIPFGGLTWTLQRNLTERYYNSQSPQVLRPRGKLVETVSLMKPREDDVWNAALRALDPEDENELVLELRGLHMGTGGAGDWDVATITWPLLSLVTNDNATGHDDLQDETLNFVALKPDDANASHAIVWTED